MISLQKKDPENKQISILKKHFYEPSRYVEIPLTLLHKNAILGHNEIILNQKAEYSAVCETEQVILYEIDAEV